MDHPVTVISVTKPVTMRFTGQKTVLPPDVQSLVEAHWDQLLQSGRRYTRGDLFTIQDIIETDTGLDVRVAETDYAHYLASMALAGVRESHACRVMHTSVLLQTSDDYLVFGEMAPHTSSPGRLQCVGGGITKDDLGPDGVFDVMRNAMTELIEEAGLDHTNPLHISDVKWAYLKTGGPRNFVGALFVARTPLSLAQLQTHFEAFNDTLRQQNDEPELVRLWNIRNTPESVAQFLKTTTQQLDEYMPELLRTHARLSKG